MLPTRTIRWIVYHFFRDELDAQYHPVHPHRGAGLPQAVLPLADEGWGERPGRERPLYIQAGNQVTGRSVGAGAIRPLLDRIFDEWVRRDVGHVYVQHFDTALANWVGAPAGVCAFSATCGLALALEHNGDLYSCDHYVEPDYLLGNIQETPMIALVASDQQRKFGQDKQDTCRATAGNARCALPATAAVPRIASSRRRMASPG